MDAETLLLNRISFSAIKGLLESIHAASFKFYYIPPTTPYFGFKSSPEDPWLVRLGHSKSEDCFLWAEPLIFSFFLFSLCACMYGRENTTSLPLSHFPLCLEEKSYVSVLCFAWFARVIVALNWIIPGLFYLCIDFFYSNILRYTVTLLHEYSINWNKYRMLCLLHRI